jgi:hypothetical protein
MKLLKPHYLLLLLVLLSCRGDKKGEDIARLVTEWQGKEVILPKNLVFTVYAMDTVDYQIPESKYKVLIYVDSTDCTGCKLQLHKWKELMAYAQEDIPFLFFFYPRDVDELYYLLETERFDWPVCVDRYDLLNQLNHFPADINFQTFLLDKDNKVVLIGNPVYDLDMRDKYIERIGRHN